jgi:hypothetical protein
MPRLRFSIRDLLWLTALCAVLVAWWVDHRRLTELSDKPKLTSVPEQPDFVVVNRALFRWPPSEE